MKSAEQGSEISKFICLTVFIDTGVLFDTGKNELVSMSGIVISGIVTFKLQILRSYFRF